MNNKIFLSLFLIIVFAGYSTYYRVLAYNENKQNAGHEQNDLDAELASTFSMLSPETTEQKNAVAQSTSGAEHPTISPATPTQEKVRKHYDDDDEDEYEDDDFGEDDDDYTGSRANSSSVNTSPVNTSKVATGAPKSTTPTQTPTPSTTTPPPVVVKNSGAYKNGVYVGDIVDAYYGNVQVKVTISGGKITNVQFLDHPQDRNTSISINNRAMPILTKEAITAQSAPVDAVSGATATSDAFNQSLASALVKAK